MVYNEWLKVFTMVSSSLYVKLGIVYMIDYGGF